MILKNLKKHKPRCLLSRHEFGSSNVTSMYFFFCKCHTFVICNGLSMYFINFAINASMEYLTINE